jgi:hypothetical protein
MRALFWLLILGCLAVTNPASAATGRVIKVLPFFLDQKGRQALHPSLYERDAYQFQLLTKPSLRSGIRYSVNWKTKGKSFEPLKVRLELRGPTEAGTSRKRVLEQTVTPTGWFGRWTRLEITGQDYKDFGEVVAWRATLWEGDQLLSEQKSFLW